MKKIGLLIISFTLVSAGGAQLANGKSFFFCKEVLHLQGRTVRASQVERGYVEHNALAKQIIFEEPIPGASMTGPVDFFVRSERFRDGSIWWLHPTTITVQKSRSPLAKLAGENSIRKIFWPKTLNMNEPAHLSHLRIAVNYKWNNNTSRHEESSLEMFAKDESGNWNPFYYKRVGNRWRIQRKFMGINVEEACIRCHMNSKGNYSPRPFFLETQGDLEEVGYDPEVTKFLLNF